MGAHSKSPLGVNSHLTCLFEKGIFLWVSTGGPRASEDSPVSVSHFPILCWACVWALGIRTRVLVFVQQTHCSENRVVMETFEFHFIFLYLIVVVWGRVSLCVHYAVLKVQDMTLYVMPPSSTVFFDPCNNSWNRIGQKPDSLDNGNWGSKRISICWSHWTQKKKAQGNNDYSTYGNMISKSGKAMIYQLRANLYLLLSWNGKCE